MQLTTNYKLKKPEGSDVVNVQDFNDNADILDNALATHKHTKSQITDMPSALKNPNALTIQLNGSSQGAYDGSSAKTINITKGSIGLSNVDNVSKAQILASPALTGVPTAPTATAGTNTTQIATTAFVQNGLNGKANSSHTHSASQITGLPTALKNPTALTVQFNGTTNKTYDGSSAQTLNITPSAIGASATSHTHDDRYYTESEINSKINTINNNINGKANSNHTHTSITNNFNNINVDTGFDGCGLDKKNNIDLNSWFGVSISNRCEGAETPVGSVNFSVNARNGDVWSRGNIFAQGNQKVYHTGNKPTPREIGAEEKYSGELSDFNNDFNNVLTQGSYSFGGNIANCPVGENKYGKLIVILNDGGTHDNLNNWIWQFILFTSSENGSIYYRNKTNEMGWSEWKLITERQDAMSFMNGWSYQSGAVNVSRNGKTCSMNVIVTGGTISDGTAIITVPPAYRPSANRWFTVPVYSNATNVYWKKVVLYADGRLCCDGSLGYNFRVDLNLTYIL